MQRLSELQAAETLEDLRPTRLPGPRCHELAGDRKRQLAVHLHGARRLVFRPDYDPLPLAATGGLDWRAVARIVVVEIVDYH